jgi:deazaflavin-dependent oxidoreductase (nitroreductase family)
MHQSRLYRFRAFSQRIANPVLRHVAPHLPWFALVTYRGRTSGRIYSIPLNVFRDGGDWVVILTDGSEAQWVQNVLAQGGAGMVTRGRRIHLTEPRVVQDQALAFLPGLARAAFHRADVTEVLRLHSTSDPTLSGPGAA